MSTSFHDFFFKVEKKRRQSQLLVELQAQLEQLKKLKEIRSLRKQLPFFAGPVNPDEMETQPMDMGDMMFATPNDHMEAGGAVGS